MMTKHPAGRAGFAELSSESLLSRVAFLATRFCATAFSTSSRKNTDGAGDPVLFSTTWLPLDESIQAK